MSLVWLAVVLLSCGQLAEPELGVPVPPTAVPVTDDESNTLSIQNGPLWVLISGVDEHGLMAEPNVFLLSEPGAVTFSGEHVHTGEPAAVLEIRQTGPQQLRRFYRIESINGFSGWVSDFYIRRIVYLYDATGPNVPLYSQPEGEIAVELVNVSPVQLLQPEGEWWLVRTADGSAEGWVHSQFIKESPEREFLINGGLSPDHEH